MNFTDLTHGQVLPTRMSQWPGLLRVAGVWKASARMGAVVGVLLIAGCATIEHTPKPELLPQAMPSVSAVPMPTSVSVEPNPPPPVPSTQAKTAERASTVDKATPLGVVPSAAPVQGGAKGAATPSKTPTKPTSTPSTAAPLAKGEMPAAAQAKLQAAAPLDLKSLETRLKETQAIGVFTKLTLKNQIDALLDQFRAFYQGRLKTSLGDLRRSYDMLVLKVLALLQEADPPLASAIAASREAIWGVLSDPAKFAAV